MSSRYKSYKGFCCVVILVLLSIGAVAQSNVSYVYDEIGRLVAVINPSGNTAVYSYDSVGNILSITPYASSTLSVIYFTPGRGQSGTSVTITGTGFSTTPSLNNVKFNGTTATVASSTVNQLVTTVPATATTGPISVTVGSTTKTSSKNFVVGSSGGPTISNISPTAGLAGTAVLVTGTNFQPNLSSNIAKLNISLIPSITSATTTNVTAPVPTNTGSGRITVSTPFGTTVSAQDFYVPPSGYTANSISPVGVGSGRISIGGTGSMALNNGQVGMMLFDGTAGQNVSALFSNGTYTGCPSTQLLDPSGNSISGGASCVTTSGFIDRTALPKSGTYAVDLIDAGNSSAGTVNLTLYNVPPDVTAPITLGGSSVTLTNTVPGQNTAYTFTLSSPLAVSAWASCYDGGTYNTWTTAYLVMPDGTAFMGQTGNFTNWGMNASFIDKRLLPAGTYTLLIDPLGPGTGLQDTATLYNATDVTGSVTINAAKPKTFTTTAPGQNIKVTFSGSAGQLVTAHLTNTNNAYCIQATLYSIDGTTVLSSTRQCGLNNFDIPQATLPVTGTYSVYLDSSGPNQGGMTISVTSP